MAVGEVVGSWGCFQFWVLVPVFETGAGVWGWCPLLNMGRVFGGDMSFQRWCHFWGWGRFSKMVPVLKLVWVFEGCASCGSGVGCWFGAGYLGCCGLSGVMLIFKGSSGYLECCR